MTLTEIMNRIDQYIVDERRKLFTTLVAQGFDANQVEAMLDREFADAERWKAQAALELLLACERDRPVQDHTTLVTPTTQRTH
jgi:hypothetical protein